MQARTTEAEVRRGQWRGPLHGMPLGPRDHINTAGVRTNLASAVLRIAFLRGREVVRRLKAAGAVLLASRTCMKSPSAPLPPSATSVQVHNPWQHDRITGGSSGGLAAAVAAGLCLEQLRTDAGGSIRVPSAYCGIVGLEPTYALVGMRGRGSGPVVDEPSRTDVPQRTGRRAPAVRHRRSRPALTAPA